MPEPLPPSLPSALPDSGAEPPAALTAPATGAPPPPDAAAPIPAPPNPKKPQKEESLLAFLVKLVVMVVVFRSFIFSPFNIPSESMLPRLLDGDYLLAAKWPYGFSSYSLPFSMPLIPGRVLATQPKRGDVVIFKAPADIRQDWIKRVIGLPGDTVQMVSGQLHLNGVAIPKQRIDDFEVAVSPNTHCFSAVYAATRADGTPVCRYPRYRETIPDGAGGSKSYDVLDLATTAQDDTPPVLVPAGALFMMGDDRDNSMDSRFSPTEGGVGMLPQANLVGRATIIIWSTDGSAVWYEPWTWFTAARWRRIGGLF